MQRNNRMTVTIERKNEKERARFSRKFLPQRALSQVKTKQNRMQLYNKQTLICQHMRLQCICFSLIFQPIFFQPVGLFSLCSDKLISNKIHKKNRSNMDCLFWQFCWIFGCCAHFPFPLALAHSLWHYSNFSRTINDDLYKYAVAEAIVAHMFRAVNRTEIETCWCK